MTTYTIETGSFGEVVVITGAGTMPEAVTAEYEYLTKKFGPIYQEWTLERQSLIWDDDDKENKRFDKFDLAMADGTKKVIIFDITDSFGKY